MKHIDQFFDTEREREGGRGTREELNHSSDLLALTSTAVPLISGPLDRNTLLVPVEHNFTLILDELAVIVTLPKGVEGIPVVVSVVLADKGLEVLGSLLAVIERHLGEEVVDDVIVGDIVEEEASLPSEEGTVDGAGGATLERPLSLAVMRETLISVVEVGDHDEPVGNAEPGEHVVLDNLSSTPDGRSIGDGPDHGKDTEIGGDNGIALRGVE